MPPGPFAGPVAGLGPSAGIVLAGSGSARIAPFGATRNIDDRLSPPNQVPVTQMLPSDAPRIGEPGRAAQVRQRAGNWLNSVAAPLLSVTRTTLSCRVKHNDPSVANAERTGPPFCGGGVIATVRVCVPAVDTT